MALCHFWVSKRHQRVERAAYCSCRRASPQSKPDATAVRRTTAFNLSHRNDIMQELSLTEVQQVSGGIIPLLIGLNIVIWTAVALK
jgi:hypothetical protein